MIQPQVRSSATPPIMVPRTYIHPKVLTVLATYKCTAMCKHCCMDSNPWHTQRLGLNDILAFIEEGSNYPSVRLVAFSGGECFLLGNDLVRAVEFATSKGLKTRCVTNGYWAKSMRHGRQRLQQLKDAGLCELNLSTGDYHQQWVSEDTVVNAACLGVELGMDCTVIMVELQRERRVSAASLLKNQRVSRLAQVHAPERFKILESPWMPMDSRQTIEQSSDQLLTSESTHLHRGCNSIFNTVVVTPERKVGFCCGLSRELIPELNSTWGDKSLLELLEQASKDFIKLWLFVDGPERILAWAASKNAHIDWERRYAHHCHACLALFQDPLIRKTIVEHYRERVEDVLMRYSVLLRHQELLEGIVYG